MKLLSVILIATGKPQFSPFLTSFVLPSEKPIMLTTFRLCNYGFNINLQCGPSVNPRDDVAFHVSFDFTSRTITVNSILGNHWGPPEYSNGQFNLQQGQEFIIDITCEQKGFQLNTNGAFADRFEHRLEPSRINHLTVDGDIILRNVEFIAAGVPSQIGFAVPPTLPTVNPYSSSGSPYPASSTPYPSSSPYPSNAPYPTSGPAPYSAGLAPYPVQGGRRSPSPHTLPHAPYPQQTGTVYPTQPGYPQQSNVPYPHQPGSTSYPQGGLYPTQAGVPGAHAYPTSPSQHKKTGLLGKLGVPGGMAATAAGLYALKAGKKPGKMAKKAAKKAMKYGIPIAGVGVGAYALKKGFKHHGHSSSSSSSSSSSDSS